jgi:hypothetical protein
MERRSHNGLPEGTLAEELARGPLPLAAALRYATEIAAGLRSIHAEGGAHGSVSAATVIMGGPRAMLTSPNGNSRQARQQGDVAAFGAVLLQMLTGSKPAPGLIAVPPAPRPSLHSGPEELKMAALRLACRCINEEPLLDIQKALTEIRTLAMLARYTEKPLAAKQRAPAAGVAADAESRDAAAAAARGRRERVRPKPPRSLIPEFETPPVIPPLQLDTSAVDQTPSVVHCPRCGSAYIYYSKGRNRFERLLIRLGIPICRCHRCYYRYIVFMRMNFPKGALLE